MYYGPGHHTIFSVNDKHYMLYHRHRLPFKKEGAIHRQICLNEMTFAPGQAKINNIVPESTTTFPNFGPKKRKAVSPRSVSVSSQHSGLTTSRNLNDGDFSTLWKPAEDDKNAWLSAEFSSPFKMVEMKILFEFPWKTYYPKIETSTDKDHWNVVADYTETGISGSPVVIAVDRQVRYVKISFASKDETIPAIWDLYFY